jgi:hypothetical protein
MKYQTNERIQTILDTFATYQGRKVSVTQPETGRRSIFEVVAVGDGRERRLDLRALDTAKPMDVTLFGYEILSAFRGTIIRLPGNLPLELDSPRGERIGAYD